MEQPGEEERAEAVGADLKFVALQQQPFQQASLCRGREYLLGQTYLRCHAAFRRLHHPRIVPKNIEPLLPGQELFGRLLDCSQIAEIQLQKYEPAIRPGEFFPDLLNCGIAPFRRPAGDVDGTVFLIKYFDKLEAAPGVTTGDYEDLLTGA